METLIAYLVSSFVACAVVTCTTNPPERRWLLVAFLVAIFPWYVALWSAGRLADLAKRRIMASYRNG